MMHVVVVLRQQALDVILDVAGVVADDKGVVQQRGVRLAEGRRVGEVLVERPGPVRVVAVRLAALVVQQRQHPELAPALGLDQLQAGRVVVVAYLLQVLRTWPPYFCCLAVCEL